MKEYLQKALADEKCGKFIKSLIKNLPAEISAGTLVFEKLPGLTEIFDATRNGQGFWLKDGPPRAENRVRGSGSQISFERNFFGTSLTATVLQAFPRPMQQGVRSFTISQGLDTTLTLIHELLHGMYTRSAKSAPNHGGGLPLSHEMMSIAAQKALVESGLMKEEVPIYDADLYNGDALLFACKGVKL